MAEITVVTPENLEYFKGKQDTYNDSKFATPSDIPTNVSSLANDAGYQTASDLQTAINNALSSVFTWKGTVETETNLPSSGNKVGDIWHVNENGGEYAWNGTAWEQLGNSSGISIEWSAITGKPSTFTPSEHSHDAATTSAAGFMSAADKTKLNGIAAGANNYTHPSSAAGAQSSGLYKITTDANGHVTAVTAVTKEDITALGIPGQDTNTTYSPATQSQAGLMSAEDKTKVDSMQTIKALTTTEIDAMFA